MNIKTAVLFSITIILFYGAVARADFVSDKGSIKDTQVLEYINLHEENSFEQIKLLISKAAQDKTTISLRGSGHSQGGHSYKYNGIVIDLSRYNKIENLGNGLIRIQAGATWQSVIEFLHPLGLSVSVMQSDYDFSVGGSVSTNVHGWQANKAPIISSIHGLHVLTANGCLIYCSRKENYPLFKAIVGGYGLLGIIIDVDLMVVPNKMYTSKQFILKSADFTSLFINEVKDNSKAIMFFARFSLHKKQFLKNLIFRIYEDQNLPLIDSSLSTLGRREGVVRWLFALTDNNLFFKNIRWQIETSKWINKKFQHLSRNQLLYHSTKLYTTNNSKKIDLLQEYFIPLEHFDEFTAFLQSMEKELSPYLMNLTLRHVMPDNESTLNYASSEMICFVMFFRGPKEEKFVETLKQLAVNMTDKALSLNGSYYLPYKPFQTKEQFFKAYPKFQEFKMLKEQFDPLNFFNNEFYKNYF